VWLCSQPTVTALWRVSASALLITLWRFPYLGCRSQPIIRVRLPGNRPPLLGREGGKKISAQQARAQSSCSPGCAILRSVLFLALCSCSCPTTRGSCARGPIRITACFQMVPEYSINTFSIFLYALQVLCEFSYFLEVLLYFKIPLYLSSTILVRLYSDIQSIDRTF